MGFPHGPINTACSESGQKFEFSSITQAQSEQQAKFQQRKKSPTIMGWIYIANTTPVFLPGESKGRGSLAGCRLWGRTESNMTEVT